MLKIHFLGVPLVTWDDTPVLELTQAPTLLRVFAFLIMRRAQPYSRSLVAGTFWPDLTEERARRALTNIIWRLSNTLHMVDGPFITTKQTVQFNTKSNYWLDLEEFECYTAIPQIAQLKTVRLTQLAEATALYRGDFLTGIDDDWCLPLRAQWRERTCRVLENLITLCQQTGDPTCALHATQQWVALDPYCEDSHHKLIELYMTLNRRGKAQAQFADYERVWQDELHTSPSAAMLSLAAQYKLHSSATTLSFATIAKKGMSKIDFAVPANLVYLRRDLEIRCRQDELYDLKAERKQQHENLVLAQAVADQLNEPGAKIDILARRAWLAICQGDYNDALALAQAGLELCDHARDPSLRILLHRLITKGKPPAKPGRLPKFDKSRSHVESN